MVVWKFKLECSDHTRLLMPAGAEILHVAVQQVVPCLWALVDENAPRVYRRFRLAGTGHAIHEDRLEHIGSFMLHDGALVFHVFDCGEE